MPPAQFSVDPTADEGFYVPGGPDLPVERALLGQLVPRVRCAQPLHANLRRQRRRVARLLHSLPTLVAHSHHIRHLDVLTRNKGKRGRRPACGGMTVQKVQNSSLLQRVAV